MNKRLIALLVSVITVGATASLVAAPACCSSPVQGNAENAQTASPARLMLASYEKVSNALASDDLASAQAAARTFAAIGDITGIALACSEGKSSCCDGGEGDARTCCDKEAKDCCSEDKNGCTKGLQALIEAKDLKTARDHFKILSAQAIELATTEEGFYVMNCSMAGENADWLQSDREIRNPYHGSRMFRCGVVVSGPEV